MYFCNSPILFPQAICTFCNHCRDLDLCRDSSVIGENSQVWVVNNCFLAGIESLCLLFDYSSAWKCVQCGRPYNTEEIERQLIEAVNRLSMSHVLQDLKCLKCKEVTNHLWVVWMNYILTNRCSSFLDKTVSYGTSMWMFWIFYESFATRRFCSTGQNFA